MNAAMEEKFNRVFRCDEHSEEFQNNFELFNAYVRGGIEFLYETFNGGDRTPEDFLDKTYDFINSFQPENKGISDADISKLISENAYL